MPFLKSFVTIGATFLAAASAQTTDIPAAVTVSGDVTVTASRLFFSASNANESCLLVEDSATYSCTSCVFVKTGNSTNENDSSFSDLNAAVSVQEAGTIYLHGGAIYTEGLGAHGFKMYQANSTAYLYDTVISTTDMFAHGIYMAGGNLYVSGVTVTTNGEFTGAFSTDMGGGTMTIKDSNAFTLNEHSNLIYSTGAITATNLQGQTLYGTAGTIDGANSITFIDSGLSVAPDFYGVFQIFNSFGAADGQGVISVTGGSIAETRGEYGLLLSSNSWAVLYLEAVNITLPSGNFVNSSATDGWGSSGENGGNATVYMTDQVVQGSIVVDDISIVTLYLNASSHYTGAVNAAQAEGYVDVYLDKTSKWTVTGTSFVRILGDSLKDLDNIDSTGNYTVYYTAAQSKNSYLGNKVHSITGGAKIKPLHCLGKVTAACI